MKKTLCITTLCAITALFSGCWKKKDKTDNMNSAMSTDAIMSDEKPIKVAALGGMNAGMTGGMSTEPSGQNKLDENTNDEQAIAQLRDKEEKAEAKEEAEEAKEEAKEAKEEAEEAKEEADEAKEEAEEAKADSAGKKKK